jgi:hypothetical protein
MVLKCHKPATTERNTSNMTTTTTTLQLTAKQLDLLQAAFRSYHRSIEDAYDTELARLHAGGLQTSPELERLDKADAGCDDLGALVGTIGLPAWAT